MITEQEIQQFSEIGAVTIDTPLLQQQLSAASAVFDCLLPFSEPGGGRKTALPGQHNVPLLFLGKFNRRAVRNG